jgi:hypothetical protein
MMDDKGSGWLDKIGLYPCAVGFLLNTKNCFCDNPSVKSGQN